MKLYYTPFKGLVHKIQVVATETGVYDRLEKIVRVPYEAPPDLVAANPLSKVPTLVLDDGTPIFGGPVIYEYLDSINAGPKLYPPVGAKERYVDMTRMSMGEWMFDLSNIRNFEISRPAEHVRQEYATRMTTQIARAMDRADAECEQYPALSIGTICIACGLHYHNWMIQRGRPLQDWRIGRPKLATWYDRFTDRPSFVPRDDEVR